MKLHCLKYVGGLLGFLAAAASTGAQAADLGSTKDIGYASVDMPAQWAGFYAGAGLTGTFSGAQVKSGASGPKLDLSGDASAGGVLSFGYNWQYGSWVAGLETNLTYSEGNHNGSSAALGSVNVQQRDYGSLQLRGGYALGGALLYATTGLELRSVKISGSALASENYDWLNLLVGAGVEYAIDPQWRVRTEAKFIGATDRDLGFTGGNRDITEGFGIFSLGVARKF